MTIVIPMAGEGSRFARTGYPLPKPLIEVDGMPMFIRAARSLPLEYAKEIIFPVLKRHIDEFEIKERILRAFHGLPVKVLALDQCTRGQAETVRLAINNCSTTESLLIFNSDSAFEADLHRQLMDLHQNTAGALQYFHSDHPRWSFMRLNPDGNVIETAEKKVISNHASTGLYFFKSIGDFMVEFDQLEAHAGELYIAPMYNSMIRKGYRIAALPSGKYFCFGTPEDLTAHTNGKYYTANSRSVQNKD